MGPASVQAVRTGNDQAKYETAFVVSEVSAKVLNYVVDCPSQR
jgi:hypothetical protein